MAKSRKYQPLMAKKPQTTRNLIVISDLHIGCQLGLCPPRGARLDSGGLYLPNELQDYVWERWEEFWKAWVPQVCRGEPFAVCLNGDSMDGCHHGATSVWSNNLADQANAAYDVLQPIVEACEGRFYFIRGTSAHAGIDGTEEERLAQRLGAIPNAQGQYSRYEMWARVGKGLVHFTHHLGTSSSMNYESSAIMRELSNAIVEAGRWNNEIPDVVARGHVHKQIQVQAQTYKGVCTGFTTPAWQLKTGFGYKISARNASPQIGGSLIRCGDEDIFVRHKTWTVPRTEEEIL